MSQYDDDFDDEISGSNAISEVRKALRNAEKQNKALKEELETYRTESRKREITNVIESRGLNPKVAGLIPADANVGEWLDAFGDLFAAPTGEPAVDERPAPPEGAGTFTEVATTGAAPVGDEGQILALIKGAKTPEELTRILQGQ